jgi:hypothetical protein
MLILFYLYQKISGIITVGVEMLNLSIAVFVSILIMSGSYLYARRLFKYP